MLKLKKIIYDYNLFDSDLMEWSGLSKKRDSVCLETPLPEGVSIYHVIMGGFTKFSSVGINCEIEILSKRNRFVFVLNGISDVYLNIPNDNYKIYTKIFSRPGFYKSSIIRIYGINFLDTINLYSKKIKSIVFNPSKWMRLLKFLFTIRAKTTHGYKISSGKIASPANDFSESSAGEYFRILKEDGDFIYRDSFDIIRNIFENNKDYSVIIANMDIGGVQYSSLNCCFDPIKAGAGDPSSSIIIIRNDEYYLLKEKFKSPLDCDAVIKYYTGGNKGKKIAYAPFSVGVRALKDIRECENSHECNINKEYNDLEYDVSVIIPTRNLLDMLKACVESLISTVNKNIEIIIIDNGSDDNDTINYLNEIKQKPDFKVIRDDGDFNFSRLCNLGVNNAKYPLVLLLNNDIEATNSGWLDHMVHALSIEGAGIVGARLIYPSGDLQHAGVATNLVPGPGHPWLGLPRSEWHKVPQINTLGAVDAVTGACLLISKDLYHAVGGLDEVRYPVSLNDIALCLKVRLAGKKVIYQPDATLIHKEGQSRVNDHDPTQIKRRQAELASFFEQFDEFIHKSIFYPYYLRRDTDKGLRIID